MQFNCKGAQLRCGTARIPKWKLITRYIIGVILLPTISYKTYFDLSNLYANISNREDSVLFHNLWQMKKKIKNSMLLHSKKKQQSTFWMKLFFFHNLEWTLWTLGCPGSFSPSSRNCWCTIAFKLKETSLISKRLLLPIYDGTADKERNSDLKSSEKRVSLPLQACYS